MSQSNLPTCADADPLFAALQRLEELHPVTELDLGNEIENLNGLMERADGSFYQRGPTLDDIERRETEGDHLAEERRDRDV